MNYYLPFIFFIAFDIVVALKKDEIHHLPGWDGSLPSRHFSGYLNFSGSSSPFGKHMHYWFVESEGNPATDPVVCIIPNLQ